MSNYSEGTQVPFGDGSHVPPEEVTDWDFESDTTMHTAMKNIFLSCDQDNSDSARVSDLINFMIPHMQEHTSQLTMLKIALDPNDIDPYVTSETFYKMMMKWTTQFMEESVKSDEDKNSSVRELQKGKEKGSPHSSVLSKSSVGKRFLKGCIESDSTSLNLSNNSSTNSCTENSVIDVSMLQEKINELEHQNRKLTEELEHSRSQLTSSEEQNESLHGEVQKLARRLLGEQQTVSQLEKDRQNTEELMEASSTAQKQLNKLEKDLASSEKQVSKLKQQINNLEVENQKFEDKIEQLVKRDTVSKQSIQKLQTELQIKEQEYSSLEDAYGQANVRLSEQRQLVTHYVNVNKTLKDDKIKMEKQYCEAMKTRISSTHAKVSRTFSESSVSSKSEHSCDRRRSKSASSGSPTNLRNIVDSSYEDDPLLWNSNQKVAPHESLECEISQANLVDTEKPTLRNTVQCLQEENNRLKIQLANNTEKVKIYSPERRDHYYETEIKALKDKIQELESDNNQKYIKIVDLMVETESLKRELKRINTKDTDEIKKLQQNISELHHDKKSILRDLQQQKCEKQNYDSIIINVQSIKHECDILQNLLQHSKQNGEDLCNDLVKISGEKYGLKSKVDKLQQSVCEMKDKNKSLNIQLQCFSNEYVKLKKNIKLKSPDELGLRRPHDYVNPAINEELSSKQNGHVLDATYKENEKALRLLEEERNTLKNRITQHESIIVLLKKEITDLSANNSKLSQNTGEKETQIVLLKQIIAHQNDNIKEITTDKDTGTVKLYEQKCENEILYEKNKELTKNINETVKQLDLAQKENEYLCVRISNLEEENKSILAEFKIITGDYKKIKDSDNELMKEYKSLVADKEILANKFETLTNDYKKMKELKEDIEQQLQEMKKQAADLSSPKQHSPLLREGTKLSSPKRKYKEEAQDHNRYTKALTKIQEKLATLEYTNKQLQSENKKLQEEFNQITNTYESLAREKEIWAMEKNEWSELKDELSQKLTKAMSESKLLEEQLYHTKQASLESLHKTNSNISCSNCPILKNEIADLTTRLNELQKQNTKIIQSRRYDRMQTTIEKLKSKSFGTEEELKREKEKFANLQLENFKLKADVDENRKKYEQEREVLEVENTKLDNEIKVNLNHYNTERKDLALKQSNLEEQLKNLQKYVIELEQERNFVTQECNSLKEKLEVSLKEKENRVKSINKETNQLKQEIQELTKQKTKLEKKLATADNLLKCKLNVDKINKENSQLKQEIEEANKQISDLEKKLEKAEQDLKEKLDAEQKLKDFQVSASQEKLNIEEQLEELQKKLEKTQRDLQKSEARNLSIRKELVDKQTANDAIQCSECSATTEQLVDENYNLQKQLKDYEYELAEIQIKLNESNSSLLSLSEHVTDVNQKLNEKRLKLNRSTLTAVNNWRTILENEPDKKPVLEIFDEEEPPAPRQLFVGPLDEEIHKFKYQIHVTSLILDTLGKLKISRLSMTSSGDVEPQSATVSTSTPQKCKKKFIPKTKTVMSRSSSPTQKAKGQTTDTSLVKSRTCPTLPALNAEASGTNDAKLSRFVRPNSPTKNKVQSKPTSGLSTQSRDSSPVNKSKSYVCSENTCYCRINNDFVCYNSQDDVYMEGNILSEDEEVELGLGSNNNSPSLSSGTLESLGLLYEGASPSWSKKEIEEKFHILVTCFMMDVVTIKERSKKQQIYQSKMESKFTVESEKVLTLLKDMKQLDRDPQIKLLVTTCLGHIKRMVGIFSLTATLATQFGALQHEQQSLKIISVMINHAANLRRVLENASPRLKCIGPSTSSPKQSQARVLSHNSGIVQLNVSSLFDSPQVIFNEVKELNGIHHHTPSLGPSGEEEKTDDDSNTEPDLTQNRLFFYFLVVLAIIACLMVGVNFSSYTNFSECGGLWRCASWDDLFAPFIKRTYQGPVPT